MSIKRILVPVDFSETSEKALRYAIDLAEKLVAEVSVVHVYHLPVYLLPEGAVFSGPEMTSQIMDMSQKELATLVQRVKNEKIPIHAELVEGIPHEEIKKFVEKLGADLIVMGTQGRTGLAHILIGSVAERVIRTSEVPVLTIRAKS